MNHRKARALLPRILDGTLPLRSEAAVRAHVAACVRCERTLAEFEACAGLVALLPARWIPLEAPGGRRDRLATLARWGATPPPVPDWRERLGVTALGALAAAALFTLVLTGQTWAPGVTQGTPPVQLARALPIPDSTLMPTGLARFR